MTLRIISKKKKRSEYWDFVEFLNFFDGLCGVIDLETLGEEKRTESQITGNSWQLAIILSMPRQILAHA